jgi:histidyl-tRNA synthetase
MLIDAPPPPAVDVAVVPLGQAAEGAAAGIAADLRRAGLACDMAFKGNMKKRMQRASASGARFAVILGDDELASGEAAVKDLATGEQGRAKLGSLGQKLSMLAFAGSEMPAIAFQELLAADRVGFFSEPERSDR